MYFASLTNRDKDFYKTFFNKKIPNDAFDENGKRIGPKYCLKYNIRTQANKDTRIANEREGVETFIKLMSKSKDFSNFVLDKDRLGSMIDERRTKFKGYKEAIDALEKVRNSGDVSSSDAAKIYRLFNYSLGAQGNDIDRQKARFFKELKNNGYGAVLDTNDRIYGKFKMDQPVIIFDTDGFDMIDNMMVSDWDKTMSSVKTYLSGWIKKPSTDLC